MRDFAPPFALAQPPLLPKNEILFYEAFWAKTLGVTLKKLAEGLQGRLPSAIKDSIPSGLRNDVEAFLVDSGVHKYNVLLRETIDYPSKLNVLDIPLLYYHGDLGLIGTRCVSVVGARKSTLNGLNAAKMIANTLSKSEFTIVSGLAAGIDTAAHTETIGCGGKTIGVIGTPLNQVYPKENIKLQEEIGRNHLLLSHVPFYKYSKQDFRINKGFFPERNKIMAALSEATIIVEASDTSGSLIQAREAMRIGKIVVILKPSYDNQQLTWPKHYVKKGALVAEKASDIREMLG